MQFFYLKSSYLQGLEENDVGFILKDNGNTIKASFLRLNEKLDIDNDKVVFFKIEETGDRFDYKVCDRCFKRLSTNDSFSNNRHKKDNFITKRPSCKNCRKLKDGKPITAKEREKWNKKRPKNYTPFSCPICNKTTIAGISKIVLDHCHKTGEVRGFLCESCNTGIGRFDDDPEIVKKAVKWLLNFSQEKNCS